MISDNDSPPSQRPMSTVVDWSTKVKKVHDDDIDSVDSSTESEEEIHNANEPQAVHDEDEIDGMQSGVENAGADDDVIDDNALEVLAKLPVVTNLRRPDEEVQLLYKGRKYMWQAKVNLHVHVIRHDYANIIEVIAYNTSTLTEAEHIYLPASVIFQKAELEGQEAKADLIALEFSKLNVGTPPASLVHECLMSYNASMLILNRLTITVKQNSFAIDCRESVNNNNNNNNINSSNGYAKSLRRASVMVGNNNVGTSGGGGSANINSAVNQASNAVSAALAGPSLTIRKPDILKPCVVRRFGKSATLVGDVTDVTPSKEEDMLMKFIANFHLSAVNQTQQLSRLTSAIHSNNKLAGNSSRRRAAVAGLTTFAKFRNDNDLLLESLSFLHVSDFMLLQSVCKRWKVVLSNALKLATSLWITSRDYFLNEDFVRSKLRSRYAMVPRRSNNQRENRIDRSASGEDSLPSDRYCHPRAIFVSADTLLRLLKQTSKSLGELTLTYIILTPEVITVLKTFTKLRRLSLGIMKIDRSSPVEVPIDPSSITPAMATGQDNSTESQLTPKKPLTQRHSQPSPKTVLNTPRTNRKLIKPLAPPTSILVHRFIPVSMLSYVTGADIERILYSCGLELTHLELSLAINDFDPQIFLATPKLQSLTMLDSYLAERIEGTVSEAEGIVSMSEFVQQFNGIDICDLLVYMMESPKEAFLLTDRRGRIVVANDAWEHMFGYYRREVQGKTIDFLMGRLTDEAEFELILEGLKSQLEPVEICTFLHNAESCPLMIQLILIPNASKLRGLPLTADCLQQDFLGELALEQEEQQLKSTALESGAKGKGKSKLDWRVVKSEYRYHLLRFGSISEPFDAY